MTTLFYSSASEVIANTGIEPVDLGQETDEQLVALIENWLTQIKDVIDTNRRRDFSTEAAGVPPGINMIAMRACSNMVSYAIQKKSSPIVKVDDYSIMMLEDVIFTPSIKSDLMNYPFKFNCGFNRLRSRSEIEDDEAAS